MRRSGRGLLAILCLSIISTSTSICGCSWIFTQPLRDDRSPYDYPVCSTDPTPPAIDMLLFVANAGTTTYVGAQDNVNQKALRVSVGIAAAAIWLLSATYGYRKISECREARGSYNTGFQRPIGTGGEVFIKPPPTAGRPPDE